MGNIKTMTLKEFNEHDCHLSPMDGCRVCDKWQEQGGEPLLDRLDRQIQELKEINVWKLLGNSEIF